MLPCALESACALLTETAAVFRIPLALFRILFVPSCLPPCVPSLTNACPPLDLYRRRGGLWPRPSRPVSPRRPRGSRALRGWRGSLAPRSRCVERAERRGGCGRDGWCGSVLGSGGSPSRRRFPFCAFSSRTVRIAPVCILWREPFRNVPIEEREWRGHSRNHCAVCLSWVKPGSDSVPRGADQVLSGGQSPGRCMGVPGRVLIFGFNFWVLARVWIWHSDCWFWVWGSRIQSGFGIWLGFLTVVLETRILHPVTDAPALCNPACVFARVVFATARRGFSPG